MLRAQDVQLASQIHLASEGWPQARWWTKYHDSGLDELIDQALDGAPSVEVARARLEQARAGVQQAQAMTSMSIAGTAQASYRWSSSQGDVNLGLPVPGLDDIGYETGTRTGSVYSAGLIGRYSFDFWGLEASAVRASMGAENAQLAQSAAVELELATGIASAYFSLQATYAKLKLLQEVKDILNEAVGSNRSRRMNGLATQTMIADSDARLQQIERTIALLDTQSKVTQETLRALAGIPASHSLNVTAKPLPTTTPALPRDLSYDLLSRRPDLVALRWYVQASFDQIDVAKAAFYPSFDIKAFLGVNHIDLHNIASSTNRQFLLLPGLTLPIFDGGRLNANLKKSRTASDVLITQYNQAVLNAVREVASAATQIQGLEQQASIDARQIQNREVLVADATARLQRGKISRTETRQARIPLINEKIQQVETQTAYLTTDIALIKALGGGYAVDKP